MALRAAMKGAALLVLLMVTLNSSCVGASLSNKQEQNDVIDAVYLFNTENNTLLLTWSVTNPSGAVRGFRVTWSDGEDDKQTHVSEAEATIDYPSNLDCYDQLTVTVTALNDDNEPIGKGYPKRFDIRDIVTDLVLAPEENMLSASWSIKCPSQDIANIVVIWEEVAHSHELSCQFPGTARDTSAPISCPAGDPILRSCKNYTVIIEPLDSSSQYIGIAGKLISGTLEEGSSSKSVEAMKLKKTSSRSVTLLWKGPNPECFGTNYVVTYTETRLEGGKSNKGQAKIIQRSKWSNQKADQSVVVNLHLSDKEEVMGHVDNLQPFTEYEICVVAGNEVTNLMCQTVQTLQAKPEKPTHLVLTNEQQSPTTIGVMWKEPSNMNGKLVNYIVRWYRDSKHTGSHNTTKLSYTIVDAEPGVVYTIAVTAVNGAGEGEAAETTGAIQPVDFPKSDCTTDSPENSEVNDDVNKKVEVDSTENKGVGAEKNDGSSEEGTWANWRLTFLLGSIFVVAVVLLGIVVKWVFFTQKSMDHSEASDSALDQGGIDSAAKPLNE